MSARALPNQRNHPKRQADIFGGPISVKQKSKPFDTKVISHGCPDFNILIYMCIISAVGSFRLPLLRNSDIRYFSNFHHNIKVRI